MRIAEDLSNILRIVRGLRKVSDCPKKVDVPCIFCLECQKSNYDEITYEDGLLKITTNSVLLNMKIDIGDNELDRALLSELIRAFSSRLSFVMDKPEEGYQISFFFFYTDKSSTGPFERLITEILPELNGIITKGRMHVRDWARSVVKKYYS
ncbi:MAG: hypothetical protein Q6363_001545 [Candidatus Njordarchaeota archaeon]